MSIYTEYGPFSVSREMVNTSVNIERGNVVVIRSEGLLDLGGAVLGIGAPVLDANGDNWVTPLDYPAPQLRKNSLIWKVGDQWYQGGVDTTPGVECSTSGELLLFINDSNTQDNSREWSVRVGVTRPSLSTINDCYERFGGIFSFLGNATSLENWAADHRGTYQHFEGGTILWSPEAGCHEVHGAIRELYAALGWERGFLGYPITDETASYDGVGRYNNFQGGTIYWRPDLGAHEVHGAIYIKWVEAGRERGPLGYPVTNEEDAINGGRFNHFENGSIYWRPDLGAHEVHGAIYQAWAAQGWEGGPLGYPLTDEIQYLFDSIRVSKFEHGFLCWDPYTADLGVFEVPALTSCLMVITPAFCRPALYPLIAHKRSSRMPAFVVDVETINLHHSGRDTAESIKLLIFDAFKELSVKYVMLMGDASLIPVRYRSTKPSPWWCDSWYTVADLYYAALTSGHIHSGGQIHSTLPYEFDNWDANNDNRYNQQHWANDITTFNPDHVDGCPDVAVGRIPAHTTTQIETYVTKLIQFENGSRRPAHQAITVLVDGAYDFSGGLAHNLLTYGGAELDRKFVGVNYASDATLPADIIRGGSSPTADAVNEDNMWVAWVGHGYETGWNVEGANSEVVSSYTNTKLPVVFCAGCSTGAFINHPPSGPYRAIDGNRHWFWSDGGSGENDRSRVWDIGNNPAEGAHINDWYIPALNSIAIPFPNEFDFPERSDQSFASAWLFNPNGGCYCLLWRNNSSSRQLGNRPGIIYAYGIWGKYDFRGPMVIWATTILDAI